MDRTELFLDIMNFRIGSYGFLFEIAAAAFDNAADEARQVSIDPESPEFRKAYNQAAVDTFLLECDAAGVSEADLIEQAKDFYD
jgi:hypothetical protein